MSRLTGVVTALWRRLTRRPPSPLPGVVGPSDGRAPDRVAMEQWRKLRDAQPPAREARRAVDSFTASIEQAMRGTGAR